VPGGDNGNARQGREIHRVCRFRRKEANGFPCIHDGREEAAAQTEAVQNEFGKISRFQIRELGGPCHGPVCRHDAGELVGQQVGDEEPRMGFFQKFRVVFPEPDEFVNGDFPCSGGKDGLVLVCSGTENGELGVVPGGDNGNARQGREIHRVCRFRRKEANGFPCIHDGREEAAAQTEAVQNEFGKISRFQIRELGGPCHGPVCRHDAGELVGQQVGDEEPRMGFFQKFRVVFPEPDEFVNGVESKGPHAGDTVKFLLGDIFADVFHDLRRAGAFPGYDRIEQVAGVIHQCSVHTEGGNRDGRHLFRI